jgi:hypothetical protein
MDTEVLIGLCRCQFEARRARALFRRPCPNPPIGWAARPRGPSRVTEGRVCNDAFTEDTQAATLFLGGRNIAGEAAKW